MFKSSKWRKDIGVRYWSFIVTLIVGVFGGAGVAMLTTVTVLNNNVVVELGYDSTSSVLGIDADVVGTLPGLGYGFLGFSFILMVVVSAFLARFRRKQEKEKEKA